MEKHVSKQIILSKLLDYLKLKKVNIVRRGTIIMLDCPICKNAQMSANLIPNTYIIHCFKCKRKYDIIELAKMWEFNDKTPIDENVILHKLKDVLSLNISTKIDENQQNKVLEKYKKLGFDLVALVRGRKNPVSSEKDWTNTSHTDLLEWIDWLKSGLNIGLKTGKKSDVVILDIDALTKAEKEEYVKKGTPKKRKDEITIKRESNLIKVHSAIDAFIGNPLIQTCLGGEHLVYKYESDLRKTDIIIEGVHVDVESEGGQVVIFPSKILGRNDGRKFINLENINEITAMPDELLKFLQAKVVTQQETPEKSNSKLGELPEDDTLKIIDLEGKCNTTFTKLGGIIRKRLSLHDTAYVLNVLNNSLLENPMDSKAIRGMINSIEKYMGYDKNNIRNQIIKYLKDIDCANQGEIELAIMGNWTKGEAKQTVTKILFQLCNDNIIVNDRGRYSLVKKMEWDTKLMNIGVPVDFKVPYFHNWVNFNWGDLIIIGSRAKYGKTTLAMNILKRLVDQGIIPYYIYNETGSRFGKTALSLGMKDGDFKHVFCSNPERAILENNAVTLFDWVKPPDFARTDNLFDSFVQKLHNTNGILICFVQLREDDTFFAGHQIGQFPCVLARYIYNNEEGTDTKFMIDMVRDSKIRGKKFEIPCQYMWETKEVKTIEEIQENSND